MESPFSLSIADIDNVYKKETKHKVRWIMNIHGEEVVRGGALGLMFTNELTDTSW